MKTIILCAPILSTGIRLRVSGERSTFCGCNDWEYARAACAFYIRGEYLLLEQGSLGDPVL